MCGHQGHDPDRNCEPLRPGWYPAGDGRHQRYYAGRDQGWTDSFIVDIEWRDPRCLHPTTRSRDSLVLVLLISVTIAAGVTLVVLNHMTSP